MKLLPLSLLLAAALPAAELKDVKSVYLYPMVGGLDQHLASRLNREGLFRVVADPKLADAVFTDQLGRQLEYRMDHIRRDATPAPAPMPGTVDQEPHASSFSRARGVLFLVDAKSRQVVWSDYQAPRNSSPRELDKAAKRFADHLADTLMPSPTPAK